MTQQDSANLTLTMAQRRVEGDGRPMASTTALYTGGQAERDNHNVVALTIAGLFEGSFVPVNPLAKPLTPQQSVELGCMAAGLSYNETARHLTLSVQTVKKHWSNLYKLFGCHSRVECVVEAVRAGILPALPAPVVEAATPRPRRPRASPARAAAPAADWPARPAPPGAGLRRRRALPRPDRGSRRLRRRLAERDCA